MPLHGGPRPGPPSPPTFVAPRRSRGTRLIGWGASTGPPSPPTFVAPRRSRGAPRSRAQNVSSLALLRVFHAGPRGVAVGGESFDVRQHVQVRQGGDEPGGGVLDHAR